MARPQPNGWRPALRRSLTAGGTTMIVSLLFVLPSVPVMERAPLYVALPLLILIIAVGVFFDILGVAVTAAVEAPFHALAAKKVPGARQSIWLLRNADRVANFCNDIVGDVSGALSGAAAAAIAGQFIALARQQASGAGLVSGLLVAVAASLTVAGKAAGKGYAIAEAEAVVRFAGRVLSGWDNLKRGQPESTRNNRNGRRRGRRNGGRNADDT